MKRIQHLDRMGGLQVFERYISGPTVQVGSNLIKHAIRGINRVTEVKTNNKASLQMRFDVPIRKIDTMMDVKVECWGATPAGGGAGWSHGYLPVGQGSFYGITFGGVNNTNPYASPTSHTPRGALGGGFGGVFNVSLQNPNAVVQPQTLLVAGGTGGANNPGFGMGGGTSGFRGRPANDPRSNGPGTAGGPSFTTYKFTAAPGSNPTSGDNNNTPGGGSGGAGYYGGGGGRRGSDGGEVTRANNGGGGGSGYVSPIVFKGDTVQGLATTPAGTESSSFSLKIGLSPTDFRNSRVVINRQF